MLKYDTGRMSESEQTAEPGAAHGSSRAISWLLLLALGLYSWNAITVTPLTGYDAGGHAGYILTILEEHRLPPPSITHLGLVESFVKCIMAGRGNDLPGQEGLKTTKILKSMMPVGQVMLMDGKSEILQ